jgi:hypothetical protein
MSELGVLDVVGAERRFNILNLDPLQHRYMCFKAKKTLNFSHTLYSCFYMICVNRAQ